MRKIVKKHKSGQEGGKSRVAKAKDTLRSGSLGERRQGAKSADYARKASFEGEREEAREDYLYGINPVKEALRAGRSINSILLAGGGHNRQIHEIIELAKERRVPVKEVPQSKLNLLSETKHHQNVAAYVSPVEYYSLEKLLLDDKNGDFVLALDGITDVHNLGAMMRTLEAAGFKYIMIPERRSAQVNSTVAKTSAGAIEFVRTVRVTSLGNAIKELKNNGYWVIGADLQASMDYRRADFKGKVVLVIGSEDRGISPSILKQCDYRVKIPMQGRINSLNASVSASILIYEALRSRLSLE